MSNSGKYLAAGCSDHFFRFYLLYDTQDSDEIQPDLIFEEKLDQQVNHVAFSSEDDLICVCTDKSAFMFSRKKKKLVKKFEITAE